MGMRPGILVIARVTGNVDESVLDESEGTLVGTNIGAFYMYEGDYQEYPGISSDMEGIYLYNHLLSGYGEGISKEEIDTAFAHMQAVVQEKFPNSEHKLCLSATFG